MSLNEDQTIISDEVCENCKHCLGPIIKMCACAQSEFYEGMVHPLGWCPWFKAALTPPSRDGAT